MDTNIVFQFDELRRGCLGFDVVFIGGTVAVCVAGKATCNPTWPDSNHRHFLGDPTVHTIGRKPQEQSEFLLHSCSNRQPFDDLAGVGALKQTYSENWSKMLC